MLKVLKVLGVLEDCSGTPSTAPPAARRGKPHDDGPEYTPDGRYIYFNSACSGNMQIWRMNPDGSNQEQVTDDEYNSWFAHISPDGQSTCRPGRRTAGRSRSSATPADTSRVAGDAS